MSSTRGVPALDPTLNRVFAELVLVAEADRDVNARPHSNQQVLGYARAARRYATARCWPEAVAVLQQLAFVDDGSGSALVEKVRSCAGALVGAARVRAIDLAPILQVRATSVATGMVELTAAPDQVTNENEEKTPA